MKNFVLSLFSIIVIFSGCISKKKYTETITKKYNQNFSAEKNYSSENIIIDTSYNLLGSNNKVDAMKSEFIPLLIYWEWANILKCDLSYYHTQKYLINFFYYYCDSLQIPSKIENKKLYISFTNIPKSFIYHNEGNMFFIIFFMTYTEEEKIFFENGNFVINYQLVEDNKTIKSGDITIKSTIPVLSNVRYSTKKFTGLFLDFYTLNLKLISKKACLQLNDELNL